MCSSVITALLFTHGSAEGGTTSPNGLWHRLESLHSQIGTGSGTQADELASILVDDSTGHICGGHFDCAGDSDCLLDRLLRVPLEVFGGSPGCASHRDSAHGAWVLCPACSRTAECAGARVDGVDWAHAGLHL